jgi:hypothetical protein
MTKRGQNSRCSALRLAGGLCEHRHASLYETCAAPLELIKRQIETGRGPYVPPHKPPFILEWIDAEEKRGVLGYCGTAELLLEAPSEGAILAPYPFAPLSLLPIISERSSPSRVRYAAPNNGAPFSGERNTKSIRLVFQRRSSSGFPGMGRAGCDASADFAARESKANCDAAWRWFSAKRFCGKDFALLKAVKRITRSET